MNLAQRIQTAGIALLSSGVITFVVALSYGASFDVFGSCLAMALVGAALVCATLERGQP